MKAIVRIALLAGLGVGLLQVQATGAAAAQCMHVGGVGTGVLEGIAGFMAEAAMKNSAKSRLGENVKIGSVSRRCAWKVVSFECTARARACK